MVGWEMIKWKDRPGGFDYSMYARAANKEEQ